MDRWHISNLLRGPSLALVLLFAGLLLATGAVAMTFNGHVVV